MTLEELIRRFRVNVNDKALPYLFSDEDVTDWLNEAQEQACIRARLLRDDATVAVTRIPLTVGDHTYPMHESVYELIAVRLIHASGDDPTPLPIQSREWLDKNVPDWRETEEEAFCIVQDDTTIRIVGTFVADDRIDLECYRLPLDPMAGDADEPEIHRANHIYLIDWAMHKGFSIPDVEVFDQARADKAEARFTKHFGPLPDADMRRITRHDVEHASTSILP